MPREACACAPRPVAWRSRGGRTAVAARSQRSRVAAAASPAAAPGAPASLYPHITSTYIRDFESNLILLAACDSNDTGELCHHSELQGYSDAIVGHHLCIRRRKSIGLRMTI
ncbi:unnamed protein product [Colias eurytheme]|nr:unnamed protein product [Colias eurytheme]